MQLNKIKDKNNKELLLDSSFDGKPFQVMMEWEKPYMKKLVENLKPNVRFRLAGAETIYKIIGVIKLRLFNYQGKKCCGIFKGINKKGYAKIRIGNDMKEFPSILFQ